MDSSTSSLPIINKSTALWFSRHAATPAQLAEISALGFELAETASATEIASRNLNTPMERDEAFADLVFTIHRTKATAVFGVFPTPLLSIFWANRPFENEIKNSVTLFSAWNVSRSVEGGKPTFDHFSFLIVGRLCNPRF